MIDPQTSGEIAPRLVVAFTQSLLPELKKLQGVSSVGMGEVRDMLAFEKQRQLLGCGDDNCLAEIGGALGVDELVTSQVTLVASQYSVSMKRMNLRRAKVVAAENKVVEKRNGEELLALVGPMIAALYPERPLKEGRTRGVDREVARRLNPPPLPRWLFVVTSVAAAGAAGAGGAFELVSRQAQTDWKDLANKSTTSLQSGTDLKQFENRAKSNATTANILFGVGGGLVVVAALEAIFTDWNNDRATLVVGPTGVGVTGTF